jgi:hypothetical protein
LKTLGIATLLCWAAFACAAASAGADEAEWLYDPTKVVEIDFEMTPQAEAALELEPDEYVPATLTLTHGALVFGPLEVGLRLKGGLGSFRPLSEKAAFKVKLDEFVDDQTVLGLERLTLNNMVQDASMVHETLAYGLFDAIGVPASRTGYAFVGVNGEPYGVYLNVETLDKISLPRWFASTQHLYEADEPSLDVAPGEQAKFEVDRGDDEDIADLEALIAAANDTEGDWSDGVAPVADLDEMTRMWAVERYVGHWDGYAGVAGLFRPNNYYLHSLDSGVFEMMPWGTDQTWVVPVEFGEPAGGLLFNNCLADASCEALYQEALDEVQSAAPGLAFDTKAICTAELLAPWQALEDPDRREYDAEEIDEGVAGARTFISLRPAELAEWLGTEAPEIPSGDEPCPDEEEETPPPSTPATAERPVALPPSSAPSPLPASFRLHRVVIDGRRLKARVAAPGAGRLRLVAKTPGQGGPTVCSGQKAVDAPGSVLLSCQLSRAAQRALEDRPLKLSLQVSFRPAAGPTDLVLRTVSFPRR